MQDISGTGLEASRAAGRGGVCRVYVNWSNNGSTWVDESAYVQAANGSMEAANTEAGFAVVGNAISNQVTITLNNQTERFTPWYVNSPLHAYISNRSWLGLPIRVELGFFGATELLTNGEFETAGAGGADVFGTWVDTASDGAIAAETTFVHGGSKAAKLTAGATKDTNVAQTTTVVANTLYRLSFYTRGDGTNTGRYSVYDVSNSADIITVTSTGVTGSTYVRVDITFTTPASCTSVRIKLWCPNTKNGIAYFDDVSLMRVFEGVYVLKGHIEDYTTNAIARSVTITARDKAQRMLEYRPKTTLLENLRTDQIIEQFVNTLPATQRPTVAAGTLVMDRGSFVIPFAWIDDEPLWGELTKIAEAEGGRIYWSASGNSSVSSKLIFENATHLLSSSNTKPTFTKDDYTELTGGVSQSRKEFKNAVEVWYYPQRIGHERIIWSSAEQYRIPANSSKVIKAEFDNAAWSVRDPVHNDDYQDFVATSAGGAQKCESTDITVSLYNSENVRQVWAQQAYITITNLLSQDLFLRKLELRGRPIITGKEQKVTYYKKDDGTIIEDPADDAPRAGWRMLTIDNRYIQEREHAEALARLLLDRFSANRLVMKCNVIRCMPWLEVGDKVTVTGPGGLSADYFVQRIDWNWGPGSFPMSLDLLPVTDFYKYTDYFLLGTSVLGDDSGGTGGRFFY